MSVSTVPPIEQFPALRIPRYRHGFVGRIPGVDVHADRAEALARLDVHHLNARRELGLANHHFVTAEQVHGNGIAVISAGVPTALSLPGVDGYVTNRPDVCLGIYVADCCAVYLVDTRQRAIGLIHSGRKGTELGIVPVAVETMRREYGSRPGDILAHLGPSIRPPWYEVDFAARIVEQCRAAGVARVTDCGICTAANPARYYSYRREKGRTGRMLALLGLDDQ